MTDKVTKLRAEIEKVYNEAQNRVKLVKDEYYEGKVDAYRNVLCIFDSMQEEHDEIVDKYLYGKEPELVDVDDLPDKEEEPVSDIDFEQELYKAFGQVKDFTLGMQIAKRFYNMGRFDAHIQESDKIVTNEDGVRTNISRLHRIAKKQEPVNEDLEKAAIKYAQDKYMPVQTSQAFKAGANWQKEQVMSKTINFLEMLGQGFTITDEITHNTYKVEQLIEDFEEYLKK